VSTIGPREQLMSHAVFFIFPNASSLIILRVCGMSGGCMEMKSDSRKSSSRLTESPGTSYWPCFTNGSV
jgi:hypothetical protein